MRCLLGAITDLEARLVGSLKKRWYLRWLARTWVLRLIVVLWLAPKLMLIALAAALMSLFW